MLSKSEIHEDWVCMRELDDFVGQTSDRQIKYIKQHAAMPELAKQRVVLAF